MMFRKTSWDRLVPLKYDKEWGEHLLKNLGDYLECACIRLMKTKECWDTNDLVKEIFSTLYDQTFERAEAEHKFEVIVKDGEILVNRFKTREDVAMPY
jgi:hypothetical protein